MGEEVALHIGAADLTWGELRMFAIMSFAIAGIGVIVWGRWHLRGWRIRRAIERGDRDRADLLAMDHDEDNPPRPLIDLLKGGALLLIGTPALMVLQIDFADELEHLLGKGWGFAGGMLAIALVSACTWAWQKVKRKAMSPEELAALEEEEEHQSWMRAFFNEPAAGLGAAVGIGIVIAVVLLTLLISGLPG